MTKSTITRARMQEMLEWCEVFRRHPRLDDIAEAIRMALAAMDSRESVELPLDYLQGHKDGLEWAAQLAEANQPETGDWLYDNPIELAKAIRKGPDMPPAKMAADSEPVAWVVQNKNIGDVEIDEPFAKATNPKYWTDSFPVYRHAQQQVVPDELKEAAADFLTVLDEYPKQLVPINRDSAVVRALRAAMKEVK